MRGLTPAERAALKQIDCSPSESANECELASEQEMVVYATLVEQGRAVVHDSEDEYFRWSEWLCTDLGRLALRVCPISEE